MNTFRASLLTLLLLAGGGAARAADYYVSTTGSNSNTGTSAGSPWRTLTWAVNHVAAGSAANPSVIHLAAGTYNRASEGTFPIVIPSGCFITIQGADSSTTLLDGSGASASATYFMFSSSGAGGLAFSNLHITGARGGWNLSGITRDIAIRHILIDNFAYTASSTDYPVLQATSIGGDVTLTDATLESPRNDYDNGGAIQATNISGSLTLTRVAIASPAAPTHSGGAIYATAIDGDVTLTDCSIPNSSCNDQGGVIYLRSVTGTTCVVMILVP